jgi:hypothetical protein
MNAKQIQAKIIAKEGRVTRLLERISNPDEVFDELYLATYSRPPNPEGLASLRAWFPEERERWPKAAQDLLWVLLNTPEFFIKD